LSERDSSSSQEPSKQGNEIIEYNNDSIDSSTFIANSPELAQLLKQIQEGTLPDPVEEADYYFEIYSQVEMIRSEAIVRYNSFTNSVKEATLGPNQLLPLFPSNKRQW
jgi:hypothetical protein